MSQRPIRRANHRRVYDSGGAPNQLDGNLAHCPSEEWNDRSGAQMLYVGLDAQDCIGHRTAACDGQAEALHAGPEA